jgi:methylated-DNA-protein-cysteine methyltransferase-like protein
MTKSTSNFYDLVYDVTSRIPAGKVCTYGDVAAAIGSPRAARQVGWALARLTPSHDVPWQRVINAKGMISGRGEVARADLQLALLTAEGVHFNEVGRCRLSEVRCTWEDLAQ